MKVFAALFATTDALRVNEAPPVDPMPASGSYTTLAGTQKTSATKWCSDLISLGDWALGHTTDTL